MCKINPKFKLLNSLNTYSNFSHKYMPKIWYISKNIQSSRWYIALLLLYPFFVCFFVSVEFKKIYFVGIHYKMYKIYV